ncbi:MAG: sulfurtransferase TusA family protein [Armatimonadetes bacterium]|nr:sulfurtransferase TusA family protein [Armatimonadota bacterium]
MKNATPHKDPDVSVDCKGLMCPEPMMQLFKAVRTLKPGQVVELVATDPQCDENIPRWCERTRNQLVSQSTSEGTLRYVIRKKS